MLDGQVKKSKYPLLFHITPLKGLLNDPNGLIKFKDEFHVFYQLNPKGTNHKNKCWGHIKSKNLINWERLPIALQASEYYDKDGIYSGSAIEKDGVMYLFYTGNVILETGERKSYQCLATSEDGLNFVKKGPLFDHPEGYTRHVRDPKVWKDNKNEIYWMILGAQTDDLKGRVILYQSNDLLHWVFKGNLLRENIPELGYMWECPDLLQFENQDCLLISPQGLLPQENAFENIYQTGYFKGHFNSSGEFSLSTNDFTELDRGFEFYAPQTFQDRKRTILFGWMGVMPPEVEESIPTITEAWVHCLSIPREIKFEDNHVIQIPVAELEMLRDVSRCQKISASKLLEMKCEVAQPFFELVLKMNKPQNFTIDINNVFNISNDSKKSELKISRINWQSQEIETRIGKYTAELKKIQMYVDGSSIEIFVNNGELVFSSRYFTENINRVVSFNGNFGEVIGEIYPLQLKN